MLDHITLAISLILFAVIALGALRTIIDTKSRSLKGWSSETNQAYLALTIAAASLLAWSLFNGSLRNLHVDSLEISGLKMTVGSLEKKVDSFSAQMKTFYAGKIIEQFNKKNWNQVRTLRTGKDGFTLEVTLRENPIPNSIDVAEGVLHMPEQDYHLDGRRLQFPANSNKPNLGITIKYYPDTRTPESVNSK